MDWQKTLAKFNKEKEFGDGKQTDTFHGERCIYTLPLMIYLMF